MKELSIHKNKIKLLILDQCNPLLYMDYKNYGVCGSKSGSVDWKIHASQIPINYNNNNNSHVNLNLKNGDEFDNNNNRTTLCFKYAKIYKIKTNSNTFLIDIMMD